MHEYLKQINDWNENNPIGTKVRVICIDGSTFETHTTSVAQFLGMDVVVVWVDHDYGCRLLKFVEAI